MEINVSDRFLTISGERKIVNQDSENNRIRYESAHGTFSRSFKLASDIVEGKIKATFKDGVLSIAIPKAEVAKSVVKKIAIG